ncbi:MAG: manganese efflux pump [Clostridia bacterium]|nr:manganese efflux pump [Clostridia bacterium]
MIFIKILLIGAALAMDAFAVSICQGLSMRTLLLKRMLAVALCFGFFQALMPAIGYFVGKSFEKYIVAVDHWIAFFLLLVIGGKMIFDVITDKGEDGCNCCKEESFSVVRLLVMAIATSIDALATGITFPFILEGVSVWTAVSIIGVATFAICTVGVLVGNRVGMKYKNKATLAGGIVLILIGTNILSEHLFGIGL